MKLRHVDDLPPQPVSHNAEIEKRVFLSNGEVNHLTQFALAHLKQGHCAPAHSHPDMTEVFLVTSGTATATIDGKTMPLPPGACLVVEPGESHELRNDGEEEVFLTYFGIAG